MQVWKTWAGSCPEKGFFKNLSLLAEPSHVQNLCWCFGPSCLRVELELKRAQAMSQIKALNHSKCPREAWKLHWRNWFLGYQFHLLQLKGHLLIVWIFTVGPEQTSELGVQGCSFSSKWLREGKNQIQLVSPRTEVGVVGGWSAVYCGKQYRILALFFVYVLIWWHRSKK